MPSKKMICVGLEISILLLFFSLQQDLVMPGTLIWDQTYDEIGILSDESITCTISFLNFFSVGFKS